jgi:hypothetical protein
VTQRKLRDGVSQHKQTKLTPEAIDELIFNILKVGTVAKALKLCSFTVSGGAVSTFQKLHPETDLRIKRAIMAYRAGVPDQDVEKIELLNERLDEYLRRGEVEITEQIDPNDRKKIISYRRRIKRTFDPAIWNIIHPKRPLTEEAIVYAMGHLVEHASSCPDFNDRERQKIMKWLAQESIMFIQEIQKLGLSTKIMGKVRLE